MKTIMKTVFLLFFVVSLGLINAQTQINGRRSIAGSVNPQTSTYQVLTSDFNSPCGIIPVSSGTFTITLVASGSQPPAGQCVTILNYGTGVLTLARSGQNINGAASNIIGSAGTAISPSGWTVTSDGVNYFAAPIGGGSGTSISSGPIASRPVSVGNAGTTYICTDSPFMYVSNGSTWDAYVFGYKVVEPVLANFTQVRVDHSTFDTTHGGIIWTSANLSGTEAEQILATAKGTGHYFVDACFINMNVGLNGGGGSGLTGGTLTTSPFAYVRLSNANNAQWLVGHMVNNSTTSPVGYVATQNFNPIGPLICTRFEDDGTTNRISYMSNNTYTWSLIGSESRTATFTPTNAAFIIGDFNTANTIHLVHWSVHN